MIKNVIQPQYRSRKVSEKGRFLLLASKSRLGANGRKLKIGKKNPGYVTTKTIY